MGAAGVADVAAAAAGVAGQVAVACCGGVAVDGGVGVEKVGVLENSNRGP